MPSRHRTPRATTPSTRSGRCPPRPRSPAAIHDILVVIAAAAAHADATVAGALDLFRGDRELVSDVDGL